MSKVETTFYTLDATASRGGRKEMFHHLAELKSIDELKCIDITAQPRPRYVYGAAYKANTYRIDAIVWSFNSGAFWMMKGHMRAYRSRGCKGTVVRSASGFAVLH
jgi:hypothetical protein